MNAQRQSPILRHSSVANMRCPLLTSRSVRGFCSSLISPKLRLGRSLSCSAETMAVEEVVVQNVDVPPTAGFEFEPLPSEILQRNQALVEKIRGELILAPLTRGGHLPFRRLCADFGANVTMSEMAYARFLLDAKNLKERALLKRGAQEECFGFQIATKQISEGVKAAVLAAEAGASWIDLNCGCPIYEAQRRGLGSILLRKPKSLAKLVHGIALASPIPISVKIRTGESQSKINAAEVVAGLQAAGAAFVTIHGRTSEQRYKRAADWSLVGQVAAAASLPVIGNGDILTHYEARKRLEDHNCFAVMTGRGALIKPWIFEEFKEGRELSLGAAERIGVYRKLVSHMKEHFGDDDRGKKKASYFLAWHFNFFCRYRPFPEDLFGEMSAEYPLISRRFDLADETSGETLDSLPLLERLLRCAFSEAHAQIADALWESSSDMEASAACEKLADGNLLEWEEAHKFKNERRDRDDTDDRGDSRDADEDIVAG